MKLILIILLCKYMCVTALSRFIISHTSISKSNDNHAANITSSIIS